MARYLVLALPFALIACANQKSDVKGSFEDDSADVRSLDGVPAADMMSYNFWEGDESFFCFQIHKDVAQNIFASHVSGEGSGSSSALALGPDTGAGEYDSSSNHADVPVRVGGNESISAKPGAVTNTAPCLGWSGKQKDRGKVPQKKATCSFNFSTDKRKLHLTIAGENATNQLEIVFPQPAELARPTEQRVTVRFINGSDSPKVSGQFATREKNFCATYWGDGKDPKDDKGGEAKKDERRASDGTVVEHYQMRAPKILKLTVDPRQKSSCTLSFKEEVKTYIFVKKLDQSGDKKFAKLEFTPQSYAFYSDKNGDCKASGMWVYLEQFPDKKDQELLRSPKATKANETSSSGGWERAPLPAGE